MKLLRSPRIYLFIISSLLFIIPFFWIKPGEMDLGGDGSRLYFYDPVNYLKNYSLYGISPFGTGLVEPHFYSLPTVALLIGMKLLLQSPYVLISLFSSLKLVVAFLAVYAITRELISKKNKYSSLLGEISSVLAGLFYIFSPRMIENWDKALPNHDQVFLNPLIFYLILRYLLTQNTRYLLLALIVSFIFATNFAWVSSPLFFSFYPLSFLFLFLYITFIRDKKLPWKGIFIGFLIFVGLHSFHLIPAVVSLFDPGSNTNTRIFNKENIANQLDYFFGVLPIAKVSLNILSLPPIKELGWISIMAPLVILLGFLFKKDKDKTILLTGIFFLITIFLLSAKITDLGIELYKRLFYVPGFTMFRNFIGQWLFVFSFFYTLLFGQALFLMFSRFKQKYIRILYFGIGFVLVLGAWPFINGELVNKTHFQSNNVKIAMAMDPKYEEMLEFIRSLSDDGKILILPFTDYNYQVIHGINNGAYVGVSTTGYLTGKKDFAGYANIAPFSEVFLKLAQEKDYTSIERMLSLLNVKYIFYNKDPLVYDTSFPSYPYGHVRTFLPSSQKRYAEFVSKITTKKIFEQGSYALYETDKQNFLPRFYISNTFITYDNNPNLHPYFESASSFFPSVQPSDPRVAYVERNSCTNLFSKKLCRQKNIAIETKLPKIWFEKINPTKYRVKVSNVNGPYQLIFSEAFNSSWKVFLSNKESFGGLTAANYFSGDIIEGNHKNIFFDKQTFETVRAKSLPESSHFLVNGYANAWNITPQDIGKQENYELIVEMTSQRIFYLSLAFSLIVFLGCVFWGIHDIIKKNND